jgi:hypothetical protein
MNAWIAPVAVSKISSEEPSVQDGAARIRVPEEVPDGIETGTPVIVSVTVTVFTISARMIAREAGTRLEPASDTEDIFPAATEKVPVPIWVPLALKNATEPVQGAGVAVVDAVAGALAVLTRMT